MPDVELLPYINAGAQITATATGTQPSSDFSYDGSIRVLSPKDFAAQAAMVATYVPLML